MKNIKRSWDLITKEKREKLIKEIINYFQTERDLEIGAVAAEDILDFFLQSLSADIYNKAIQDLKATIKQSFDNLEIDLDMLLQK